MKYLIAALSLFLFTGYSVAAQNTGVGTKVPSYPLTVKDSLSANGNMGFAQVSPNGLTAIGTYVTNGVAYLQTHTKDNLNFATNNGATAMILDTLNNVGIGTSVPSERLDVNGNMNVAGQLKLNSNAGTSGQVLMKDGSNNPMWADLSNYKYLAAYNCTNTALTPNTSNCPYTWTVPAGVTSIYLEAWSGGGGGSTISGGGGGGYMAFQSAVTPGASVSLTIGAGGFLNGFGNGVPGGATSVTINGAVYSITGGGGGVYADPNGNTMAVTCASGGGILTAGGALINHIISVYGDPGHATKVGFTQVAATEWARTTTFGDGGDPAMLPGTGQKGGYRLLSTTYNILVASASGGPPGVGGASDTQGGRPGIGGAVIIHY